jgi:hypothetical protein
LALEAQAHAEIVVIVILGPFYAVWVKCSLHEGVIQDFGDRNSLVRDKHKHTLDEVSRICRDGNRILEITLEDQGVQILEI